MRHWVRRVALLVTLAAVLWLGYRWIVLQPTNQRDWEYGMDVLAHVTIDGDTLKEDVVTVRHRDAMTQDRVRVPELQSYLRGAIAGWKPPTPA